jgi:hypothetical protein
MSYREVYKCDICEVERHRDYMMGCRFKNNEEFVLDSPGTTQGKHICTKCLDQLTEQLAPKHPTVCE